jgi:hypothetical protein
MKQRSNIEDFLRNKLEHIESAPTGDWNAFERKLQRALWARRARSFASVALFAFALFAGYNGIQHLEEGTDNLVEGDYTMEVLDFSEVEEENLGEVYIVQPAPVAQSAATTKSSTAAADTPQEKTSQVKTPAVSHAPTLAVTTNAMQAQLPAPEQPHLLTSPAFQEVPEAPEKTRVRYGAEPLVALAAKPLESMPYKVGDGKGGSLLARDESTGRAARTLVGLDISRKHLSMGMPISLRPPMSLTTRSKQGHYISPLQEKNPWSYAINVYPNFTFRQFKVDRKKLNLLHRDFIDAIEASEKGGFSLNVGLGISRRVGDITYLNGGVEYITYNTEASFNFSNFRDANMDEETGVIRNYSLKESPERIVFADRNSYHYVNFPLSISYKPWASSHIRLNLEAGGSFMYFVAAKGRTIDYQTLEEVDLADRTYKNTLGSFSVKVGANYYVSESINFGFEPTLMYFTNTIYTEEIPFYVIPYSVGLNLHMQVKLN